MRPVGRGRDAKLAKLADLVKKKHPGRKIIIFTQFADTVHYLVGELENRGVRAHLGRHRRFRRPDEAGLAVQP